MYLQLASTVEPPLSGPPLSGTSIIRLSSFLVIRSENGRVPKTCMRVAAVTMETCLLIFCACAYNHVAPLFINKVGGSRCSLSLRLSGIFTYPACFWNQGVRIIEVLLYTNTPYAPFPYTLIKNHTTQGDYYRLLWQLTSEPIMV